MKYFKFTLPTIALSLILISCNGDDDTPEPVNEEEVITTVILNLQSDIGNVTLSSIDIDGDGPDDPVVTSPNTLKAGTTYTGTIQFLNETESPVENITLEVQEEADEHQVFYIPSAGLNATFTYTDFDADGNPLGTEFTLTTGAVSTGNLNVTLRHEPNKPNDGTLGDAGGETDVSVNFDVVIEE